MKALYKSKSHTLPNDAVIHKQVYLKVHTSNQQRNQERETISNECFNHNKPIDTLFHEFNTASVTCFLL